MLRSVIPGTVPGTASTHLRYRYIIMVKVPEVNMYRTDGGAHEQVWRTTGNGYYRASMENYR
jgi:hypothetical protein